MNKSDITPLKSLAFKLSLTIMPSLDSNALPFFQRPDLSPFLVHLTKNTVAEDEFDAFANLVSILKTGEVFGSTTKKGFIKGKSSASCFMDIPLSSLKYILNEANTDPSQPRYEPFGIVVSKEYAYKSGCRPVLYLSDTELKALQIPQNELWRGVKLEGVDGKRVNWWYTGFFPGAKQGACGTSQEH